jgi:hypothetical protein
MKKILQGVYCLIICSVIFATLTYAGANNELSFNGFKVVSKQYHEKNSKFKLEIQAHFPILMGNQLSPAELHFNQLINQLVDKEVQSFKKDVIEFNKDAMSKTQSSTLNIQYDITAIKSPLQPLLSVKFTIETFLIGTAHPNVVRRTLNYDLSAMKEITLASLFKANANYSAVLNGYCSEWLAKKTGLSPEDVLTNLNYASWNIQPKGLLFSFDDFPYALGPQQVLVPYGRLKNILRSDSPIQQCLDESAICAIH